MEIDALYRNRFNARDCQRKNDIWKVLCNIFFQRYVDRDSIVLDIGAGYCEFINNIQCKLKYAVDLNNDTLSFANPNVKVVHTPSTDLSFLSKNSIDVVFMSNFLEHLKTKEEIVETLREVYRVLKVGGRIMIVQPNIRYLQGQYWDFFDHHIPLTDKSVVEVLSVVGFEIDKVVAKFLPYTVKKSFMQFVLKRRPTKNPFLIKIYLKVPLLWKIMGKQMFVLGKKPCTIQ